MTGTRDTPSATTTTTDTLEGRKEMKDHYRNGLIRTIINMVISCMYCHLDSDGSTCWKLIWPGHMGNNPFYFIFLT